jgi:hypothetical protein
MSCFEYRFFRANRRLAEDETLEEWAASWASALGEHGWEFVNFDISSKPIYGEQPDIDEYAPVVGQIGTAGGFAKRRVDGPPYR